VSGKIVLETDRLLLRRMERADYDALYRVLADSDIMRHYPYTFDENRVRNWIEKNMERYRVLSFGLWAVCLKSTGEMIGDCGVTMQNINGFIMPEIGYHLRKDFHRQGLATEAACAVRDWVFQNTPFGVLSSYMKKDNLASIRTAIAYGCRKVGEFTDEEGDRTCIYSISREEWKKDYEK